MFMSTVWYVILAELHSFFTAVYGILYEASPPEAAALPDTVQSWLASDHDKCRPVGSKIFVCVRCSLRRIL